MIVTDRFVSLDFPRTGSTFVRQVLREAHGQGAGGAWRAALGALGWGLPRFRELTHVVDRTLTASRERRRSQHGALSQIPAGHRHKPVVSVARHPFDRVVSLFEHRFWRTHPPGDEAAVRARFPSFPELDFAQYLELLDEFDLPNALKGRPLRADVGSQTVHFVRFYARDPDAALERLTDEAIDSGAFLAELGAVRFLRFERLVDELAGFLAGLGLDPGRVPSLREPRRVNAAPSRANRPWTDYLDAAQARRLRHKERLLFRCFPEYAA